MISKRFAGSILTVALVFAATPAIGSAQQHGGGHPASGGHATSAGHASAGHAAFGSWHAPSGAHTTPISHAQAPRSGSTYHVAPNSSYRGAPRYSGTTHYTSGRAFNASYAARGAAYPGAAWVYGNQGRWYNGYWHNYWSNASWAWFDGFYGFWFPLDGANVFVYEVAPGVCQYWDGSDWVPYYDPATGYYCPY